MDTNNNIQKAKNVPSFVRYCSAIIPTMFDDSLSYYEALCALNNFLQTNVIDTINNNAEVTESYIALTNQLQEFVTNYFDNLNVQQEINNKLDEMAEDGTLADILDVRVNEKFIPYEEAINSQVAILTDKVNAATSGSPAGVYATAADLTSADPNHSKIYLVLADGKWYYYDTSASAWTAGGTYQGSTVDDNSVGVSNLKNDLKRHFNFRVPSYTTTNNHYISPDGTAVSQNGFFYTSGITLYKGETIEVLGSGYNGNVAIISRDISDTIYPLVRDNSNNSSTDKFTYTANENMTVVVSSKTNLFEGITVYTDDTNSDLVLDDNKHLFSASEEFMLTATHLSYNINPVDDPVYKNEVVATINSDGTIAYGWNWYLLRKISFDESKSFNHISLIVDIKATDISECSIAVLNSNGSAIQNIQKCLKTVTGLSSTYQRFILDYDLSGTASGLSFGICQRKATTDSGTITMRMLGVSLNQYGNELSNTPLTAKDIVDLVDTGATQDEGIFDGFLSFGVIGDSLASGEAVSNAGGVTTYVDNYDYSWGQFIAREHGIKCINFSKGGATTRSWLTGDFGLAKLNNPANKCNGYIIGLGVNDANNLGSIYIGSPSDIHQDDPSLNADTFYGNYGKIISAVKAVQPKAKIFVFTIPENGSQYTGFNTAIRAIASMFDDVYLIDLYSDYKDNFDSGFIRNNRRAGHYNSIGYKYMSTLLYNILSKYMLVNYTDFNQIEFIGTDYSWS